MKKNIFKKHEELRKILVRNVRDCINEFFKEDDDFPLSPSYTLSTVSDFFTVAEIIHSTDIAEEEKIKEISDEV